MLSTHLLLSSLGDFNMLCNDVTSVLILCGVVSCLSIAIISKKKTSLIWCAWILFPGTHAQVQLTTTWTQETSTLPQNTKWPIGGYCNITQKIWFFGGSANDKTVISFDPANKNVTQHNDLLNAFPRYNRGGISDAIFYFHSPSSQYISQFFTTTVSFNYQYIRHTKEYTDFYVVPFKIATVSVLFVMGDSVSKEMYIFDTMSLNWYQGVGYTYHTSAIIISARLYQVSASEIEYLDISGSIDDIISRNWQIKTIDNLQDRTTGITAFYNKYSLQHELWSWGGYSSTSYQQSGIRIVNTETFAITHIDTPEGFVDALEVYVDFQDVWYVLAGHWGFEINKIYSVQYIASYDPTNTPTLPSVHPSSNPTQIPSTINSTTAPTEYPTTNPSNNIPTVDPTNDPSAIASVTTAVEVETTITACGMERNGTSEESLHTNYTVSIDIADCDETECDVNTEDISQLEQIIMALSDACDDNNVHIFSTDIMDDTVVIRLSVVTHPDHVLDVDIITHHIEVQVEDLTKFDDVSVEEDRVIRVPSHDKDGSQRLYMISFASVMCLIVCILVCGGCYYRIKEIQLRNEKDVQLAQTHNTYGDEVVENTTDMKKEQCMDCAQVKTGKVLIENGLFYCDECWEKVFKDNLWNELGPAAAKPATADVTDDMGNVDNVDHESGKCVDCGFIKIGRIYESNSCFYCDECWIKYYQDGEDTTDTDHDSMYDIVQNPSYIAGNAVTVGGPEDVNAVLHNVENHHDPTRID